MQATNAYELTALELAQGSQLLEKKKKKLISSIYNLKQQCCEDGFFFFWLMLCLFILSLQLSVMRTLGFC